jgi:hypothetical protein
MVPFFAFDQRRSSSSSSSSRPTRSVIPVACSASKRLSTTAGRSAAQARTGPPYTLEVLCSEVLKLEQVANELSCALGEDDHVRLRNALQACGKVRCLADNRLLLRSAGADQVTDDYKARCDAYTRL